MICSYEIKRGGVLKVHTDFNRHPNLSLDRRINVLIYLNKNWKEEYGGHLELWDKDMTKCIKKIAPTFNTMVIFSTTDFSNHGHPDPLNCPNERSRKSIALYYFSSGRPEHEIINKHKKNRTYFKNRGWSSPSMVTYMESHDEERVIYKALNYGNSTSSVSYTHLTLPTKRIV